MKTLFDYWSIPHFLFGVVTALISVVFGLPAGAAFLATLAFAILWEFFEMRFSLVEATWNVASDIVLPLLAFPVTLLLVGHISADHEHLVTLLIIATGVYIYTNVAAWRARMDGDRDFMS